MSNTISLQPLSSFTFSVKDAQPEEDPSVAARLQRLQNDYEAKGMRRSVEAVLVVHDHGHPHILMLQIANAFFKLPGHYLAPGEDEVLGIKRRLDIQLTLNVEENTLPINSSASTVLAEAEANGMSNGDANGEGEDVKPDLGGGDWEVGDCLGTWWRPNYETYMYPYKPPHVSKPKEEKKMYLIHMPERKVLAVPKNMKLLAIPLFELYDNTARYGAQLAALVTALSKYDFVYL